MNRLSQMRWQQVVIILSAITIAVAVCYRCASSGRRHTLEAQTSEEPPKELLYGFDRAEYIVEEGQVGSGQTLSHLLEGYASVVTINRMVAEAKPIYNFNRLRAGNKYTIFSQQDSLGTARLRHFVLETSQIDVLYVSVDDSLGITVRQEQKEQRLVRRKVEASITSSLWNCLVDNNIHPSLAVSMEDVYGWSVNFFALQEGDNFTVVFDERYIEDELVGVGTIWGSRFNHGGKDIYAIPFDQNGKLAYWDEDGNSMRKQFLKAPLKYTRISSGFSMARRHPVTKKVRAHPAIDYAAPAGTPVMAIADGKISARFWDKNGGGNVLKIKHNNGYESSYLHLKGYAKGMTVGKYVTQGQVIAYVGSTGMSTGPHLDFRIKKNGKYVNPRNLPSAPVEPIKKSNVEAFNKVKEKVMAELGGEVSKRDRLGMHDLYPKEYKPEPLSSTDSIKIKAEEGVIWQALKAL